MFSKACEYGIRALTVIAEAGKENRKIARDLDKITLYDIVEAIDGKAIFNKCGLGLTQCNAKKPCPLHFKFEVVRDELNAMCKENTLLDLVEGFHKKVYQR